MWEETKNFNMTGHNYLGTLEDKFTGKIYLAITYKMQSIKSSYIQ